MDEEGLWFIREGREEGVLGKWEVWFRPVAGAERLHAHLPTQEHAVEAAHALNELGRRGAASRGPIGPQSDA